MRKEFTEKTPTTAEKAQWKQDARQFLKECMEEDAEEQEKKKSELPKTLDRLAAFYLTHTGDWQLQTLGVKGYMAFAEANTPEGTPVEKRMLLNECQDSFGVNVSRVMYLLGPKRLRLHAVFDFFHKRHNMKLNAYKRAGFWPSLKLQYVVFEVFRGPFKGYAFWRMSIDGMKNFLAVCDEDDPIMSEEFEAICAARNLDVTTTTMKMLREEIGEAKWLQVIAPKSTSGRWCSFEDAQRFWEPHLAERLAATRYLGVQQGWHTKTKDFAKSMVHHLKPAPKKEEASSSKQPMKAQEAKEAQQRDKCVNGLHFSAVVMANDDVQFDCRGARLITEPEVNAHKHWAHFLRGGDAGMKLAYECASGKLSTSILKEKFVMFNDYKKLQDVGLETEFTALCWRTATLWDAMVQSERQRMQRLMKLQLETIKQEVEFYSMWRMFPSAFAGFLTNNDAEIKNAMAAVKRLSAAWKEAKTKTTVFWKGFVPNMSLDWVVVQETFELFESSGWIYTERCDEQVRRLFNHMMSSILCERGFKWARDAGRDNANEMISELSLWEAPTRRGVLKAHDFKEVTPPPASSARLQQEKIRASFFKPLFKKSSDTYKDLPGRGATKWKSAKPEDLPHFGGRTDYLALAYERGEMAKGPQCWRAVLMVAGMIVYKAAAPEKKFLVLGTCGPMVVYLWPVTSRAVTPKIAAYEPLPDGNIEHEVVHSLAQWMVVPTEAMSPAELYIKNGHKELPNVPTWPMVVTGRCTTLLKASAQECFKGLGKAALLKLDREEVNAVTTETSKGQILLAMLKKF